MNGHRKTATIVGVLFLISYFGVFAGSALLGPILDAPDYLANAYPNKTQVMAGVLLELVNGIAVVGIAVLMFPLLKQHGEGIALGYVGTRIVECMTQVASDIVPLSVVTLSQESAEAGAPDASAFQTVGAALLAERQSALLMLAIFFSLGALLFYYLLYQSQLVPRFIPVWGVIGVALVLALNLLETGVAIGLILALPIILNEIFLAIWLIVKGFNPSAVDSGFAKTDMPAGQLKA
jgi:hypothetical protein